MAKRPRKNQVEEVMARSLDQLAAYEEFASEIAPALRGLVKRKASPEEIYNTVLSAVAARAATIALTSKKPTEALSAIKEIMDRAKGRATEKREVTMQLASDSDLDNRLKQLMGAEESENESEDMPN